MYTILLINSVSDIRFIGIKYGERKYNKPFDPPTEHIY